jgi:hypothetical protein
MKDLRKIGISAALVAATLTGGALGATFLGTAGAADSSTSSSTTAAAAAPSAAAAAPDPTKGGHVANGITEALLTGDTATKVSDAAKAAVPGATIDRVENDAEGAAYEAHMTKADGSRVTVKVNADFTVASTEAGM